MMEQLFTEKGEDKNEGQEMRGPSFTKKGKAHLSST
jgi:hypothetical protein